MLGDKIRNEEAINHLRSLCLGMQTIRTMWGRRKKDAS